MNAVKLKYEKPESPDLTLSNDGTLSPEETVNQIIKSENSLEQQSPVTIKSLK